MLISLSQRTIRRLPLFLWLLTLFLTALLACSLYSNLGVRHEDRSRISEFNRQAQRDLVRLRSGLNRVQLRDSGSDRLLHVALASRQLQPRRPPPAVPPSEDEAPEAASEEEIAQGGPLAEDWEYAGGVFFADDPARSRVWLRKKVNEKTSRVRYTSRSRYRGRTSRVVRSTRSRSRRTTYRRAKKKDTISFYATQDRFEDEDLEIEFLIRSVDWNELVYSRPEAPEEEYVLERVDNSPYAFSSEKRLEPFTEDESDEEDENEAEKHFRVRAPGYVDRTEEDYQRLLRGEDTAAEPGVDL